ncbi:MFS transporter [Pengzhenrongella frigida]|uniref:MFS transporter n=1 Tax=Pengzhenrongella frigida TaxID=1259133 RepID=A0A4Q5MZY6_9MICO|nr:MFS transporter [Cellulomonas sp. HLT2-17]RYV51306.1 MFS transporter [Cellulomonas sp. HLT2-17]
MRRVVTDEKNPADLSKARRWFLLILVSIGSSIIYTPAYLKSVFYDPLMDSLDLTNAQLGALLSAYAITATICYLPSGIIADKVRVRTLASVGFISTALLTFVYAALPSYGTLVVVFIGMGITTILIWWGIRYKLVRLISEEAEYAKNIGLSYGFYGAAGLVVGFVNLGIVNAFADNVDTAVTVLLAFLGALILVLGILSLIFIPKFENELAGGGESFKISDSLAALKSPVVWISAMTMFFVYFYYTGVTYTTPYLTDVFSASLVIVSVVGIVRTYGVTLLAGPAFGGLAHKAHSPARVIWIGSIATAVALVVLAVMPVNSGMIMVAAGIAVLLGFIANGVFGIVSSQLTEGKVPLGMFGAATGILSVVGFLPDTFSSAWFGGMIDNEGNAAYPKIFLILAVSGVLAAGSSVLLRWYIKRYPATDPELERVQAASVAA